MPAGQVGKSRKRNTYYTKLTALFLLRFTSLYKTFLILRFLRQQNFQTAATNNHHKNLYIYFSQVILYTIYRTSLAIPIYHTRTLQPVMLLRYIQKTLCNIIAGFSISKHSENEYNSALCAITLVFGNMF